MQMPVWLRRGAQVALAAAFPIFAITAAVLIVTNFVPCYEAEYARWRVGDVTGLTDGELARATREVLAYFWGPAPLLDIQVNLGGRLIPLYNEREIAHMRDVKTLFRGVQALAIVTGLIAGAVIATGIARRRTDGRQLLGTPLLWGGGLTLAVVMVAGLGSLMDFDRLFLQFHMMSFSNDFWMLDPRRDYLVMMFPTGFWLDATLLVGAIAAAIGAAAFTVGWRLLGAPLRPAAAAERDAKRRAQGL
ncbi:MAG: TIGR01906 family membrane protein [Chloroflexi bacterium]|nr:TIGR01906 family membrane protein [Chloroflexota bacterium]